MAQFDVHEVTGGYWLVDCQSDLLAYLQSRFTVPLEPAADHPTPNSRFHPRFIIEDRSMVFATHLAGAIPARALGRRVGSLILHEYEIKGALDMLISGI